MKSKLSLAAFAFLTLIYGNARAENGATVPLGGTWRFALDRADIGATERWFNRDLPDQVKLPGSLQEQGFGEEPSAATKWTAQLGADLLAQPKYAPYQRPGGEFKTPFWLTPRRHYVGPAWYQRDVEIPAAFAGKRAVLRFERPHWQSDVWLDDRAIGSRDSLGVPHEYDLTTAATPGKHRLTVRVDNRVKVAAGLDAHSISDQTQSNWNGIIGDMKLIVTDKVWVDDVQIYPDAAGKKVKLAVRIGNLTGAGAEGRLTVSAKTMNSPKEHVVPDKSVSVKWDKDGGVVEFEYELGPGAQTWDEFAPALYRLEVALARADGNVSDVRTVVFGLRDLGTAGTRLTINGRPIFLRGTLECCIFPLTGYPPTEAEPWRRIMRIAREHGLNHLRFHSWCPPEAAFAAADEAGVYLQVEASCWTWNFGGGDALDRWVTEEGDRMLRAYGNHPSFVLMVVSNEPNRTDRNHFLGGLVEAWAKKDPRRRYAAGSGWPILAENQYQISGAPRLQGAKILDRSPNTEFDYREFIGKQSVPVVSHEIGQWCAYPNFDEIPKYTGVLKAGNLEIFRDFLRNAGMGDQANDFLMATGKFQAALYKADIEAALRTPGMGGFQLLDLHDFPGQGTAPVGVLDAFWEPKGYITAEAYRRFCGPTVPLARMAKCTFTADESFKARVELAHFGQTDLRSPTAAWRVRDAAGKVLQSGSLSPRAVPTGSLTELGEVNVALRNLPSPARLTFEVTVEGADGAVAANDWNFWVYPAKGDSTAAGGVRVATNLDDATLTFLINGGSLLLLPSPERIAGDTRGSFQPIFWNRVTFPNAPTHTMGVFCDPKHPALAAFPTDSHTDWQWWDLMRASKPMILDVLPKDQKPIVQVIDDWNVCRKLGLVFEGRVGKGRLLVCSIDLETDLGNRPVARQLRRSLMNYVATEHFAPTVEMKPEQVRSLLIGAGQEHP